MVQTKKHITLVYVCPFRTWNLYPPLGLGFLASCLRAKQHPVTIVDTTFQSIDGIYESIAENSSVIVGFEILQSNYAQSLALAEKIKARFPSVMVLFGGPFPTAMPEAILQPAVVDLVHSGEGEEAIVEIMEHLDGGRPLSDIEGLSYKENGAPVVKPPRTPNRDLDAIPPAAYDLLQMESYLKIPLDIPMSNPGATLSVTRGCYGNCNYCQPISRKLFGRGIRRCSPGRVVDEIQWLLKTYHLKSIYFADDEPLWKAEAWWEEIIALVRKRKMKFDLMLNSRVDTVREDLLRSLKSVGLKYLAFGVESADDEILKKMRKGYTADKIIPAFELCRKLGIVSRANIMVGSPGETWESINRTYKMLSIARPDVVSISVTSPIPGTDLFDSMKDVFGSQSIGSDIFDRKHYIPIAENFTEGDIKCATRKIFKLFMNMTFTDLIYRPWRKMPLIKMMITRELSLARIHPLLPLRDIAFHLGYMERTFI